MRKALLLMVPALLALACATLIPPTAVPTQALTPTSSASPEPTLSPSASPSPTLATTPSLTPYPAFAYAATLWPTPTAPSALDCRLNWQSPGNGIKFKPRDSFSAGWKVTNTGTATWTPGSVEFDYVGGAKLYIYPRVQLRTGVPPGQSVILTAEMRAPKNLSRYTTYWSLRQESKYFCTVALTIYVEQ